MRMGVNVSKRASKALIAQRAIWVRETDTEFGRLPDITTKWADLQTRLEEWQIKNFGEASVDQMILGATEELGELCHARLKHSQGIRGMADKGAYVVAAGDAIADCTIFLMQIATALGLDFETLVHDTAEQVMKRDWRKKPEHGTEGR